MDDIFWKFQIQQTTNLSSKQVLDRTHSLLFENGYRIIKRTDNAISFDNGSTGLRWVSRYEDHLRLNKGTFEFIIDSDRPIIKFTYFISYITELVFLILITIFAIGADYWFFLGILPFAIQFAFKLNTIKGRAKKMLLNVSGNINNI
jgi:hypothetical protein